MTAPPEYVILAARPRHLDRKVSNGIRHPRNMSRRGAAKLARTSLRALAVALGGACAEMLLGDGGGHRLWPGNCRRAGAFGGARLSVRPSCGKAPRNARHGDRIWRCT